ncbi:hypothetical protein AQUCO_02000362v1 [Aquilegia coerulea]|uniref:Nucleolus and neural progenitor protein-like N-terminal domain-containing protein n=1 Tax=Aquilegia coerulea TaxID=218851 RepID=A0A2G5DH64_AQUCA|nr:hypothetical protein AQUCO_02000362v1 [Aquilegia coerulea]
METREMDDGDGIIYFFYTNYQTTQHAIMPIAKTPSQQKQDKVEVVKCSSSSDGQERIRSSYVLIYYVELLMRQESEDLEKRIRSLLAQIQYESAILDKIAYKGKNQHRRAFYFQYLLKVRRDTRLLLSANLEEIFNYFIKAVGNKKPSCRIKKRKLMSQKHHFRMRLLGVARLLSQKFVTWKGRVKFDNQVHERYRMGPNTWYLQLETQKPTREKKFELFAVLARKFFMAFSVVNLALLASLRVLILLDVVLVFNMLSSSSQDDQSAILTFEGVEIFREYHPSDNDVIALECLWEAEKFVLHEKTQKSETSNQVKHVRGGIKTPLKPSSVKYQAIEAFLGEFIPCLNYNMKMTSSRVPQTAVKHIQGSKSKSDKKVVAI